MESAAFAGAVEEQRAAFAAAAESQPAQPDPLHALCLIARLHHVVADPAALRHAIGKTRSEAIDTPVLLLAAQQVGLKAKQSRSTVQRLPQALLPALARLRDDRWVVLAQCDGQRVLIQDAAAAGSRPTI